MTLCHAMPCVCFQGANILVANDGTVKLADFGASKSVGHKSLTATGIKGTPM